MNYYNEFDSFAAQWLRNLIAAGHIPAGDVDERGIEDVRPVELMGYEQCHFFAGIGGWPLALKLSGWTGPAWTGSCPCQPFSAAGTGKGTDDERHLWPHFRWLISQCKPAAIFGEQVASKAGRDWLAGVRADLEALDYEVGAADLCAAGVGAPHIRQRLFWVANSKCERRRERPTWRGYAGHAPGAGKDGWRGQYVHCADEKQRRVPSGIPLLDHGIPARVGRLRGYGNAIVPQVAAEFISAYMDAAA